MREKLISFVPSVFTIGNVFCGYLAIIFAFEGRYTDACWVILLGAFLDFLDGSIARFTRSVSEIGVQLDSFADFISFGIAPAVLLYSLGVYPFGRVGAIFGLIYIAAGAFRLSRYNFYAEEEKKSYFIGLPIPAAGILVVSYILFSFYFVDKIILTNLLTGILMLNSWLMVSGIRYKTLPYLVSAKNKRRRRDLIFLLLILVFIIYKPMVMLFPTVFSYIIWGFLNELKKIILISNKDRGS